LAEKRAEQRVDVKAAWLVEKRAVWWAALKVAELVELTADYSAV
jgi:hypothetical protein